MRSKITSYKPLNTNYTTKQHTVMKRSTSATETTLEILRGRDGRNGRDGVPGPRGPTGLKGEYKKCCLHVTS